MKWKGIYKWLLWSVLLINFTARSQEFNARVTVDASSLATPNLPVFKTLEKSLADFINKKHWTDKNFRPEERIECDFRIVITQYQDKHFTAQLNVTAYRPVYHTTYRTITLNLVDKHFAFNYQPYQPLEFNDFNIDDNLTATIAYYIYMIIGYDFDSFKIAGGKPYFEKARKIADMAASNNLGGWTSSARNFSRQEWVNQVLDPQNTQFHNAFYTYHRTGLDLMADDPLKGKSNIIHSIQQLNRLDKTRANLLLRLFFDAKSDEIMQLFSGGPVPPNQKFLYDLLMELAPYYKNKWDKIH